VRSVTGAEEIAGKDLHHRRRSPSNQSLGSTPAIEGGRGDGGALAAGLCRGSPPRLPEVGRGGGRPGPGRAERLAVLATNKLLFSSGVGPEPPAEIAWRELVPGSRDFGIGSGRFSGASIGVSRSSGVTQDQLKANVICGYSYRRRKNESSGGKKLSQHRLRSGRPVRNVGIDNKLMAFFQRWRRKKSGRRSAGRQSSTKNHSAPHPRRGPVPQRRRTVQRRAQLHPGSKRRLLSCKLTPRTMKPGNRGRTFSNIWTS